MNSPVLRGEDEPETFSCQLYFFPKELLFNVSCEKEKQMKRVKERKAWSPSSGSWKSMNTTFCPLSLSISQSRTLIRLRTHTLTHTHSQLLFCWMRAEWESFVCAQWCEFKGNQTFSPLGTCTHTDTHIRPPAVGASNRWQGAFFWMYYTSSEPFCLWDSASVLLNHMRTMSQEFLTSALPHLQKQKHVFTNDPNLTLIPACNTSSQFQPPGFNLFRTCFGGPTSWKLAHCSNVSTSYL